ncbi:MAG: hypothetical protein Q4G07_05535 [Oscillospiraceae bacterium]|nr:hypothetical protein [Oscillospiraceae bacterium]
MSFLVTASDASVVLDTMPALKLTSWNGSPARDTVYSYGKLCLQKGSLALGGWVFDGRPPESQRFCAAFNFAPALCGDFLSYTVSSGGVAVCMLHQPGGRVLSCAAPQPQMSNGNDEQGYYWAFEALLPKELIAAYFGQSPAAGSAFSGNLFLYDAEEDAFGSAFPVPAGRRAPTAEGFGDFVAVPY